MPLNALQLRHEPEIARKLFDVHKRYPIVVVLDNVYDTFNIGGAFRSADSFNAQEIILLGENIKIPPDKQIRKSSIHISDYFKWRHFYNRDEWLSLVSKNDYIMCVEKKEGWNSEEYRRDCKNLVLNLNSNETIYLVVGNETLGIDDKILSESQYIVEIPMYGIDHSMNVINALNIVGLELAHNFSKKDK